MSHPLDDLPTPSLLLDQRRFERNLARMREHLAPFGVTFRPHLKTAKSIEAARQAVQRPDGPAPDYLSLMRHNVSIMAETLRRNSAP